MRSLRLLIALLALAAALAVPGAASATEVGLNVNGGAAATTTDFDQLSETGSSWARHFLYYDDIGEGLAPYDNIVAQEDARGVKTLLVVAAHSHQPPANPQAYADYVGRLAQRWKGRLEAIEIWNEQDEPGFWAGGPQPARYVDLLQRSYTAIKAADPAVKVVFGATVGNNYEFLEQTYDAGAKGYFDVMAAHTDTACLVAGPKDFLKGPDGRIMRWSFLGYRELRATMLANEDPKPIWLTEIGWSAAQHSCEVGTWAGQKLAGVSEPQQAEFLKDAFHCLSKDPYVQVAMWFNNRDLVGDGKMYNSYGLLRADGSRRPVYDAYVDVARHGNRLSGPCGDFGPPTVQVLSPRPNTMIGTGEPLSIRVTAPDEDVLRFTLRIKGAPKVIRNFTNANKPFAAGKVHTINWQGAKQLPVGKHTLVVSAADDKRNEAATEVSFTKVDPITMRAQATRFPAVRVLGKGRTRTVAGRLEAALPFRISGKVTVQWQNRRNGRWKKIHGAAANAHQPFRFKQKLKYKGRWRARVVYKGKRPFKSSASKWVRFTVR